MMRSGNSTIHALFLSRSVRIALVAPIAALALLASQGSLRDAAAFSGCVGTPFGTAVLYNPAFTVSGVVNATGCGNGIVFDGDHTGKISGATIFGAEDTGGGDGDGIHLDDSGTVTVLNSTIRDNHDAGVDERNGSDLVMTGSKVTHDGGRGLDIRSESTATVFTTFITNTTDSGEEGDGDGVHLGDFDTGGSGLVKITGSNISNNADGGIDDHYGSSLFMNNDNLTANTGYGVDIEEDSTATINSSFITGTTDGNAPEGDGDGISADGSGNVTIVNSQMNGNYDDGVDIDDSSATILLKGDVMKGNGDNGLYMFDIAATVTESIFLQNDTRHIYGAGVYLESSLVTLTLTDAFVQQNVQDGIYLGGRGDTLTMTHGFVLANYFGLENYGFVTANRSVLCKNKTGDLYNALSFTNLGTTVCHST
jgi:parallel beta-helix repeat protein